VASPTATSTSTANPSLTRLASNKLDVHRASLLLYSLQILSLKL